MIDTILLFISIVAGIGWIIITILSYKKDKLQNNPKAASKLTIKIVGLGVLMIVLNTMIVPLLNYYKPKDQLATKNDIKCLSQLIKEIPRNPSMEEVESEIDKEIKAALKKQKEKALFEYESGNKAYKNNNFQIAITHFKNAIEIIKISSFYLALGNTYTSVYSTESG